jgi:hypothetical protein
MGKKIFNLPIMVFVKYDNFGFVKKKVIVFLIIYRPIITFISLLVKINKIIRESMGIRESIIN